MGCGPPSKPTLPEPVAPANKSAKDGSDKRTPNSNDSIRSNASSKQRRQKKAQTPSSNSPATSKDTPTSPPQQNNTSITKKVNSNGNVPPGKEDPHWIQLWEAHQPLLLDPADVHSTIEEFMARGTNKLSATEITFMLRKIRAIVRSSTSQDNRKGMGRILSNSSHAQVQETRAIAERFHLLSGHVIRRLLPKLPASPNVNPTESAFLLLVYMHESLWDRVAEIAVSSSKEAGLVMDVNKHEPLKTAPDPCSTTVLELQDLPAGVSFHSLTFLIGMALRGSRIQRLQLLFYLLIPAKNLHAFLQNHLAGGVPLWLLEIGNETVISLASLSHYYWYGDAFNPSSSDGNNNIHQPRQPDLTLDGQEIFAFLKSILAPPTDEELANSGHDSKPSSPMRKSASLGAIRRRTSNQSINSLGDDLQLLDPTVVMDRLQEKDNFVLEDYLQRGGMSTERFLMSEATLKEILNIADFYDWANSALDDSALDALMHRIFAHTILTNPSMEAELVRNYWREWQETECAYWSKSVEPEGALEAITQSVKKMLSIQNGDSDAIRNKAFRKAFGGIGGFDGRGGMGYGVMYCVDKKWWDHWERYVGWSWTGDNVSDENKSNVTRQRPGELSTEALLNRDDDDIVAGTFGSYELMKTDLKKDIDYVLVPPGVWDILYEIYGGGPPLPRMVKQPKNSTDPAPVNVSVGEPELRPSPPTETDLDAMASSDNYFNSDRVLRVPQQMTVQTHPWILHLHLCDPQQPYRRGDAGPMSIRVMALPDQPLWRLYGEIVVRLPFNIYKAYDLDGRGRARLWKRTDPTGPKDALSRYGPWTLLCKNRFALLPRQDLLEDLDENYNEIRDDWQVYADNASVESIGLTDGDQIMVECAILDRNGDFRWPREAAAKAGRVRRLADRDMKFRRMLRGLDENGKILSNPPSLVGMIVDAMDASGRWYQVEIAQVQTVVADTDEEEDSAEMDTAESPAKDSGEHKQVRVDFSEHGGHSEWIDVDSDRLATAGRFTLGKSDDPPDTPPKSQANGTNGSDTKPKPQTQVKKTTAETTPDSGKLCTIPGYGACGLANLGNTCYFNSAIQCISYLPLLRSYLLSSQYRAVGDLNKDNPLGTGGKLLEEFADLLRQMWSAKVGEKSPTMFRRQLGKTNNQFAGADQQDAQEFLNFLLDVLHEDTNRVRKKPYVEGLEDEWVKRTSLPRVGEEAWRRFLRRNRSVMADVAMGQVLNTVTCPTCHFSSRNFDPFNLLSIPFPTVADVIFKCKVVRRANAFNTPWVLNRPKKNGKWKTRFIRRDLLPNPKPPSEQLIVEQYIIAMSRLADSGDLKLQIQNLSGIPASDLRLCRAEEFVIRDKEENSVVRRHTQVTLLTDKEGPCSQLARQRANSEDLGTAPAAQTLIVAFESTLRSRPPDDKRSEEESSSSTGEDDDDEADVDASGTSAKQQELEKHVALYGNIEECRLYDTETLLIAKAISRSLWPRTENELKLGLRVDAIDHREHWFPGSVVEILENDNNGESKEGEGAKTKVRIHFDNFSSKWDEMYTIDHFNEGRVRPLYSHASPRAKPTEFAVHHRFTDRVFGLSNLFGQSFYVQCHNEWSTARAGAQILSQASRFLRQASESSGPIDLDDAQEREAKVQRLYDRTQTVISDLMDLLIDCDREYVHYALGIARDPSSDPEVKIEKFRNPGFDATALSTSLVKKVNTLLQRLPFEVRVCTVDSPLGGTNEEVAFPFSLMRTIGNYMNARHAVVLQWREPPSDKKATGGRHSNYLGAPVMYVPPKVFVDEISADILDKANQKAKRNSTNRGSGGLQLGVCLTEFCKVQQLSISDNWRCPRCKEYREGKQNLTLWRLPDLLTFHIKRFNCSARWREKITTKVNFPLSGLDMTEWCHSESPVIQHDSKDSCVYDLIGVLNHYGGMTGGHYVATCKATACGRDGREEVAYDFNGAGTNNLVVSDDDPDVQTGWRIGRQKTEVNSNKVTAASTAKAAADSAEPLWLQFDDDLVEPIPPRYVVSEMAYVLFYRRRRITPSNIARYSTLE